MSGKTTIDRRAAAKKGSAFSWLVRLSLMGVGSFFAVLLLTRAAVAAPDTTAPRVLHAVVAKGVIGQNLDVKVEFQDQSDIFEPKLYFRRVGELEYNAIDLVQGAKGMWIGTIPATFVTRDIEYFLEAFDIMGNGPGRNGSPEKPHIVKIVTRVDPVEQPRDIQKPPNDGTVNNNGGPIKIIKDGPPPVAQVTPVHQRGWFVAVMVIGALAVAGGVTVGVLAATGVIGGPSGPASTPNEVTVRITAPDPRTGL
ncbi:MAG: hypothetical protein IT381_09205 [Deltaproteobacteria bacterium]|nr:hypothetical protein [Deltaproteobacteria bacterium]